MSGFKKLTNLISGDVVVEDIGVRLRGVGDSCIISSESADSSKDLIMNSRFLKIKNIRTDTKISFWPFVNDSNITHDVVKNDHGIITIKEEIQKISESLQILLERPSPEVVVDKIKKPISLQAGHSSQSHFLESIVEKPMFIPSKITIDEENIEMNMKVDVSKEVVDKTNFEDGLTALRNLRKKK